MAQSLLTAYRFPTLPRGSMLLQCTSANISRPAPVRVRTCIRHITNATKPDYIPALLAAPRVTQKPGGWHPTLVHSSGEVKWTVIRLQPDGGEMPKHSHSTVWDYFVPLDGEAVIETETKDGVKQDFEMVPGAFLAVGPDDIHRVRNKSKEKEFVFLIAQSPRSRYDFVAV